MESHTVRCRLGLLAGLLVVSVLAGCGRKQPATAEPVVPVISTHGGNSSQTPNVSAAREPISLGGPSLRTPDEVQATAPVSIQVAPLSEDELKRFAELQEWTKKAAWSWEPNSNLKRQRPVGLIVLSPDGLQHSVDTSLEYARGLANACWDVKILLHLTGKDRSDMSALNDVQLRIHEINKAIMDRNKEEAGKIPNDVAPLREIDAPATYRNAQELEASIDLWLASSFLENALFRLRVARLEEKVIEDKPRTPQGNPPPLQHDRPLSRPPFGGISFNGHGRSVRLDKDRDQARPNAALQFKVEKIVGMVKETDWFDLSRLEALALRKYQAPVWLLIDLCRTEQGLKNDEINDITGNLEKLELRDFGNNPGLSDALQKAISECESLRANASAGFLHRQGSGVTTLYATRGLFTVDDDLRCLLHGHFGTMLKREAQPGGFVRFNYLPAPTASITLEQARSWAARQLKEKGISPKKQEPDLSEGTLSERVVVFSTLRGKDVYLPQYPNLLSGGLSLANGGFTVPELADVGGDKHYGSVAVIRKQKAFDNDFKSIFQFKQPFDLVPGAQYKLVLLVSARGTNSQDFVRFTTGVYDTKNQLLNSSFQDYSKAESYLQPIKCDGAPRLIHVPLTWFNNPALNPNPGANLQPDVEMFEIQAAPDNPESNWKQEGVLYVHAVYLMPTSVSDDELESDIKRVGTKAPLEKMCIWDVPLHASPDAVSPEVGEKATVLKQSIKPYDGLWGAVGEVYPKLYTESGKHQLRIKVDGEDGSTIEESAEVCVYVCSAKVVLAAWLAPLKSAVTKEQVVQFNESGLMQEIVVALRNYAGPLKITRLEIENIPARK
jgi:hypothetical protein